VTLSFDDNNELSMHYVGTSDFLSRCEIMYLQESVNTVLGLLKKGMFLFSFFPSSSCPVEEGDGTRKQ
jgi:hypothetical protein